MCAHTIKREIAKNSGNLLKGGKWINKDSLFLGSCASNGKNDKYWK